MSDLPKRLRIKASMIALGERIAWGSDTALMEEAADVIEALSASVENHQLHMLGMARDRDQLRAMLTAQPQASAAQSAPVVPAECADLNHHERYRAGWNACRAAMLAAAPAQGQQVEWRTTAVMLEQANAGLAQLNGKLRAELSALKAHPEAYQFDGQVLRDEHGNYLAEFMAYEQSFIDRLLHPQPELKAQQVGQEPAVPECVERIRTLLPRFEAGVNWTGEDAAELAEAAYDAAELLTTKPAPDQDVACPRCAARDELDRKIEEQQA